MKFYKELYKIAMEKLAKNVAPTHKDKAQLKKSDLYTKYKGHYDTAAADKKNKGKSAETLAFEDMLSATGSGGLYDTYKKTVHDKNVASATAWADTKGGKAGGVTAVTNPHTQKVREALSKTYKGSMASNVYSDILGDWGGPNWEYKAPATAKEKKSLSKSDLFKDYPDYYKNEGKNILIIVWH